MTFSRDVRHYRATPRSLSQAFGPYSRLHVEKKSEAAAWLWAIFYGAIVGAGWYALVALKAGA